MAYRSLGPLPGIQIGSVDTCVIPSFPVPVTVPCPNVSFSPTTISFVPHVFLMGSPAANLVSSEATSTLDFGVGVASGTSAGPTRHTTGAIKLFIGAAPATKTGDPTFQNLQNTVGNQVTDTQDKVRPAAG